MMKKYNTSNFHKKVEELKKCGFDIIEESPTKWVMESEKEYATFTAIGQTLVELKFTDK